MNASISHAAIAPLRPVSNRTKLFVLAGLGGLFLAIGFFLLGSFSALWPGLKIILTHPSRTDFDTFAWAGNLGVPFIQTALCLLMVLGIYALTHTQIGGPQIAAACMVIGFAFFGKNILNLWFPLAGVFLHAKIHKKDLATVTALGFFAGCLGPIFSTLAFGLVQLDPGSFKAVFLGTIFGILSGYLTAVFASYYPRLHGGLLLYNAGMAAGFAAILLNSLFKATGLKIEPPSYQPTDYLTGENGLLAVVLLVLFLYLMIAGICLKGIPRFLQLFWHPSGGECHLEHFGFGACLLQMGVTGLAALLYVFLVGGQLGGPAMTGIWAMVGFSTFGSTLRRQLPLIGGVVLGAFLTGAITSLAGGAGFFAGGYAKLGSRGMLLTALFTCGVAPIVSKFGIKAGLLVGIVQSIVVGNIGILHGWMSLYNNGLSLGLITTLLFPIYSRFAPPKAATFLPTGCPKEPL